MDDTYDPAAVERAAQHDWNRRQAFRACEDRTRRKFYACSMLPYPSGKLHMGHVRNYTINDVMYRSLRMQGFNVLMPMGWDAFGLPAENAAIEKRIAPAEWTRANIADMKEQMQPLGLAFDWSREVATCDPSYYRWNQWLFLKMLEKGIAYRRTQTVNWDPIDQTVLANEQVIDGRGWRSGAPVEKREIPGYYLAITRYAGELLDFVQNRLDGWPPQVRTMQENWIGRSFGVNFGFPYDLADPASWSSTRPTGSPGETLSATGLLRVFTTRADTIMGVTFVAIAAEHPLAEFLARGNPRLAAFIEECRTGAVAEADVATLEKKGMATGFHVLHPLTGDRLEVWVGNYVLMGYGEGAVMGVPAHDERDFAFAKKYGLPIRQVIRSSQGDEYDVSEWRDGYADKSIAVCVNSGPYDGMTYDQAVDAVAADLEKKGLGGKQVRWRLRDWGISRQRYWGTPIPIIHCGSCGPVPVPEKDLPVLLPEDLVPDGTGNPLNRDERFLACTCPACGKPARRETDTMDTFVDSAWYYMRYCCPDADEQMVDERVDYWMPMDQYIGGIEHAVLHLLYARFWTKVMRDLGLITFDEPFTRLFTQGMLLAECYYREDASGKRRWFYPTEVNVEHDDKGRPLGASAVEDGLPVLFGGIEKMSKSKNNVVEPRDIISRFGADTARAYVMFAGPPAESAVWHDSGVEGVHRFLKRFWNTCYAVAGRAQGTTADRFAAVDQSSLTPEQAAARRAVHLHLEQALRDYERVQYNTVVSACMKMLNAIETPAMHDAPSGVVFECIGILLRVLYPVAPHVTQVLWNELGFVRHHGELLDAPWPAVDADALKQDEIEVVVQVNGKLRGRVTIPADAGQDAARDAALADQNVMKFVGDKPLRKVVFVPGKLVNLVV